jgi:hypothetical protein
MGGVGQGAPSLSPEETAMVAQILDQHKDKNFVKRILNPSNYPVMENKDGTYSTHRMAYGESAGRYYVYPTIIHDESTGELKRLSDKEAWHHAMKTGEHIAFFDEKAADWFSSGAYKAMTGTQPTANRGSR